MQWIGIGMCFSLLAAVADAQVIEDFENSNLAGYTAGTSGSNVSLTAQAAHDGTRGALFVAGSAGWLYRTDVVMAPGDKIRGYLRAAAMNSRIYMGFSAGPAGCWSAVAGPNTSVLELQRNDNYGFATIGSSSFGYEINVWYLLEIDWASNGDVTLNLYDESGQNQLASAGPFPGPTSAGGFAFRGFATGAGAISLDTVEDTVVGATVLCSGDGSGTACPCGNSNDGSNAGGAGCANSHAPGGASLTAGGSTSLAAGDFVLSASGAIPNTTGFYFQGDLANNGGLGLAFGDGLMCAGGNLVPVQIVWSDSNGDSSATVNSSVLSSLLPSDTRIYQMWFRDPVQSVCASGSNMTNGLQVTWMP